METCLSFYVDFGRCVDKCCWAGLEIRGRKLAGRPLLLIGGLLGKKIDGFPELNKADTPLKVGKWGH